MKKILALFLVSVLLVGCDGRFIKKSVTNSCSSTGWTITTIHYGDAYIRVIPISKIVDGAEWRFILDPGPDSDGVDYGGLTVKVRGKTGFGWFVEQQGTADADGSIKVCINTGGTLSAGDVVYYDVEIVDHGQLDPRGRIIDHPAPQ